MRSTSIHLSRSAWRWMALSLLSMLVASAHAGDAAQPLPEADALRWLARISTAANQRSYRGTMVVTTNGVVSSSRVAHLCVGDEFVERVEALDGRQHRIYRHNEIVHTVWPQERVVVVERGGGPAALALSARRALEPRALDHYLVLSQGSHRVAGRSVQVLLLQPRDDWRLAQRLWADEETGLLLRTDVLGSRAKVLESASFGEVEIGLQVKPEVLLRGMTPAGYRIETSPDTTVDLAAEGWAVRHGVPGFELVTCLKRSLPGETDSQMLQAVFSDGLTFVSVFIEPFDARRHTQAVSTEMGATRTAMQRDGAYWLTVVGDVPQRAIDRFLHALERRR